jgi:hypothetical protein
MIAPLKAIVILRKRRAPLCTLASLCALLVPFVLTIAAAGQKKHAVAPEVEPYARGCSHIESFLLGPHDEFKVLSATCSDVPQAWLTRLTYTDGQIHKTDETILDHLLVRTLAADESFSSAPYCYKDHKSVQWLAIYSWNHKKRISGSAIHEAWVPNLKTGKFELASPQLKLSVFCTVEGD